MPESRVPLSPILFGPFEADLSTQELRKQGIRLRLPRQSFQILKMLLERPGELVNREELHQALWPSDTFVDFEHGLNAAVNRLREVLGDNADNPRYIETLPRRGYRFVGTIAQPAAVQDILAVVEEEEEKAPPKTSKPKWWAVGLGAAGVCALLALGLYWFRAPMRPPRVLSYRQLTKDRSVKGTPCGFSFNLVTDGPRVFFSEPSSPVMQVSSSGGDAVKVNAPFACFKIFDISPDKTELLGASQANGSSSVQPLWVLSLASGLAHRLGDLSGHAGAFSPDGQNIVYATDIDNPGGDDLYIAAKDGSETRKLVRTDAFVYNIQWSPDGKVLRMDLGGYLWEMSADGTDLRRVMLFPGEDRAVGWMKWTAGGKYFVFSSTSSSGSGAVQIWAFLETKSRYGGKAPKPFQLTTGATSFWDPVPSPDGKHIFAIGGQERGELVRYDLKLRRFEPFLSGISADQVDFSRDGKWVAYVTFPEGILWRSKVDGSERMQLTPASLFAATPHWSPDGTRIAFAGTTLPDENLKIYVVSAKGGKPEMVSQGEMPEVDPTWSADSNSLVFGGFMAGARAEISSVDLRTRRVSIIPGSEGMFSPRVSPDGRFIVTIDATAGLKLSLYDRERQGWSELQEAGSLAVAWPVWSSNSKYLYLADASDLHAPKVNRIRIAGREVERVAALEVPEGLTGYWGGSWMGVGPDGSPLLLRDLSIEEIYALDVDFP